MLSSRRKISEEGLADVAGETVSKGGSIRKTSKETPCQDVGFLACLRVCSHLQSLLFGEAFRVKEIAGQQTTFPTVLLCPKFPGKIGIKPCLAGYCRELGQLQSENTLIMVARIMKNFRNDTVAKAKKTLMYLL